MSLGSLIGHYNDHQLDYMIRMFIIGLFSTVQLSVVLAYLRSVIAKTWRTDEDQDLLKELPLVLVTVTPLLGRIINSRYFIRLPPAQSLIIIGVLQVLGWVIFISDYYLTV